MSTLTVHAVLVADGWGVADADAEVRFVRVAGITRPLCACGGGLIEPTKKPLPLAESTVLSGGPPGPRLCNKTLWSKDAVCSQRVPAGHSYVDPKSDRRPAQTELRLYLEPAAAAGSFWPDAAVTQVAPGPGSKATNYPLSESMRQLGWP